MIIGERLRQVRQKLGASQGEIARRSGFKSCYISRVENGHTIPALETLERWAQALRVPLYELFYEDDASSVPHPTGTAPGWSKLTDIRFTKQLHSYLSRTSKRDRAILLRLAKEFAREKS